MAMLLVIASLKHDDKYIQKTLDKLDYHLRRNATAYKSHSLKNKFEQNLP